MSAFTVFELYDQLILKAIFDVLLLNITFVPIFMISKYGWGQFLPNPEPIFELFKAIN